LQKTLHRIIWGKIMSSIKIATHKEIDERVMAFINNVKPRLVMGELQVVAALSIYLKSGDEKDIPGVRHEDLC
jgi:hypothetical protein